MGVCGLVPLLFCKYHDEISQSRTFHKKHFSMPGFYASARGMHLRMDQNILLHRHWHGSLNARVNKTRKGVNLNVTMTRIRRHGY